MASLNMHAYVGPVKFRLIDRRPDTDTFCLLADSGEHLHGELQLAGLTVAELIELRDALADAILARHNADNAQDEQLVEIPPGYRAGHEANTLVAPDGTVLRQV